MNMVSILKCSTTGYSSLCGDRGFDRELLLILLVYDGHRIIEPAGDRAACDAEVADTLVFRAPGTSAHVHNHDAYLAAERPGGALATAGPGTPASTPAAGLARDSMEPHSDQAHCHRYFQDRSTAGGSDLQP